MRSAPSISLVEKLIAKGVKVSAYDPVSFKEAKKIFGDRIEYAQDMYECLKDARALIIVTEWPQFKEPDFNKIINLLAEPLIIDGRNIYPPIRMREIGFKYICIGRPSVK